METWLDDIGVGGAGIHVDRLHAKNAVYDTRKVTFNDPADKTSKSVAKVIQRKGYTVGELKNYFTLTKF